MARVWKGKVGHIMVTLEMCRSGYAPFAEEEAFEIVLFKGQYPEIWMVEGFEVHRVYLLREDNTKGYMKLDTLTTMLLRDGQAKEFMDQLRMFKAHAKDRYERENTDMKEADVKAAITKIQKAVGNMGRSTAGSPRAASGEGGG